MSSGVKPLVVTAAVPTRIPDVTNGDCGSLGMEFLLTVIEKADCKEGKTKLLKIRQAKSNVIYQDQLTGTKYTGESLRHGISFPLLGERDHAEIVYLKKI